MFICRLFGENATVEVPPSMVGEDFSYYGLKVPSAFMLMGIGNEAIGSTANLHNQHFLLDESVLHRGAAYHTAFATAHLEKIWQGASKEEL